MKRTHAVFGALLLLACTAATAEIYKWKDADGQMRYSDKPPPASVPPQNIQKMSPGVGAARPAPPSESSTATPAEAGAAPATGNKTLADKELEERRKHAAAEEQRKKDQQALEAKKIREQNCASAKSSLMNYKIGGRMYKLDENGERVYIGDEEITAGQQQAQKEVDKWCN